MWSPTIVLTEPLPAWLQRSDGIWYVLVCMAVAEPEHVLMPIFMNILLQLGLTLTSFLLLFFLILLAENHPFNQCPHSDLCVGLLQIRSIQLATDNILILNICIASLGNHPKLFVAKTTPQTGIHIMKRLRRASDQSVCEGLLCSRVKPHSIFATHIYQIKLLHSWLIGKSSGFK